MQQSWVTQLPGTWRPFSVHLIFRVDGDAQIGAGHLYRCLTLANAMKAAGHSCVFLCSRVPDGFGEKLTEAGHRLHLIQSDVIGADLTYGWENNPAVHADQLADWEACQNALSEISVDLVVVDHYLLDQTWESQWVGVPLMVIDDLANREHESTVLLNQNLGREAEEYLGQIPTDCRLLMGPSYALLRPEFAKARAQAKQKRSQAEEVSNILVNFGAADAGGLTLPTVQHLTKLDCKAQITIVCGSNSAELAQLSALVEAHVNVELVLDSRDMANQMLRADLAVGAPGATSWERCALGLPSILVAVADNQKEILEELSKSGTAIAAANPVEAAKAAIDLAGNFSKWRQMTELAFDLCDGRGVQRAIDALAEIILAKRQAQSR